MNNPDKVLAEIERLSHVLDQDTRLDDKYFHGIILGLLLSAHNDRLAGAVLDRVRKKYDNLLDPIIDTMETLLDGITNKNN